jgi:hypothetical protein
MMATSQAPGIEFRRHPNQRHHQSPCFAAASHPPKTWRIRRLHYLESVIFILEIMGQIFGIGPWGRKLFVGKVELVKRGAGWRDPWAAMLPVRCETPRSPRSVLHF